MRVAAALIQVSPAHCAAAPRSIYDRDGNVHHLVLAPDAFHEARDAVRSGAGARAHHEFHGTLGLPDLCADRQARSRERTRDYEGQTSMHANSSKSFSSL